MRILMINDTYPPNVNGAALSTERLAKALAKRKHNIFIIAPSTAFKSFKRKEGNITIYRLKSIPILIEKAQDFRISPRPLHAKEIQKIVEEVQPDIMHVNEPWLLGMSAVELAKQQHIPIITSHHFMPENLIHYLHLPAKLELMLIGTVWKWYAKHCENFEIVICPTPRAKEALERYSKGVELKVISNGIDLKKFSTRNNGEYLKERYKLPNITTLLFVGRLDKEKNIDVLIRAIALIKQSDFHLVIIGQGKEKKSLQKLAADLGVSEKITFTDYLPKKDLPNIYTIADIFVIPSVAELQSLVTMEAMASGLPVVGANAVALPHLIKDGKNGFLFKPGDEKDLAQKLVKLLTDKKLRTQMGKDSLEIIKEHDIEYTVSEMEKTYEKIIANYKLHESKNAGQIKEKAKSVHKLTLKKLIST